MENLGRATDYGLLTQKLGLSPSIMPDILGGRGYTNNYFYEVCLNGWFKLPCDCRAVERGCSYLPLHYTKAEICVALQSIEKRSKTTNFQAYR